MNKYLYYISRYTLAALFIFSGMVKCIDPMGTELKLIEYFNSSIFPFSLEFAVPFAAVLSVLLCTCELMLGLMLLVGAFKRMTALFVAAFMTIFTILTLIIYIDNPVSDCGCFGDVIILSNGETFFKNCVFEIFSLYLLYYTFKSFSKSGKTKWYYFAVWTTVFLIPVYSYIFLPSFEVLPFKIGADINEVTNHVAESKNGEVILRYKNKSTAELKEFKLDDPEWQDENKWEFVETVEGVGEDKISVVSFDMLDKDGNEVSQEILSLKDTSLIIVSKDINTISGKREISDLINFADANSVNTIVVTSSYIKDAENYVSDMTTNKIDVYNMDETTLKTLLRASSGVVAVSEGVILGKWNSCVVPEFKSGHDFEKSLNRQFYKYLWFIIFVLAVLFPALWVNLIKKNHD